MKFVTSGLLGFLVVVIIGYLWFVPIHEIADQFVVGYGIAIENIGAELGLRGPRNYNLKPSREEPPRYEIDESRIPYPRPRRRSTRRADQQQTAMPSPTDSMGGASGAAVSPTPTLRATTINSGAVQQTQVYVDPSGKATTVVVEDGDVVEQLQESVKVSVKEER